MTRILSFSGWLSESLSFPDGWSSLPEWELLKLMGISIIDYNQSTGTITINNPYGGKDLRLTPAGYVRTSNQGYLFHNRDSNSLSILLKYVVERFAAKGLPSVSEADLDFLLVKHPELLPYLSASPKIKAGVMKRTGLKDPKGDFYLKHGLTPKIIKWLDKCTQGTWELNPHTGEVDVDGWFTCKPGNTLGFRGVRFGTIEQAFDCSDIGLTSLEGAPRKVSTGFSCANNLLTSLKGAPSQVGENFNCRGNQLKTLEGAPDQIPGNFQCENNLLEDLTGAPNMVGKDFNCERNPLESLSSFHTNLGERFKCDAFHNHKDAGGWNWGKMISGKKNDSWWIKDLDKTRKLLIPLLNPAEIAKIVKEDIGFVKFIPKNYEEEVGEILGYEPEEFKSLCTSAHLGLF